MTVTRAPLRSELSAPFGVSSGAKSTSPLAPLTSSSPFASSAETASLCPLTVLCPFTGFTFTVIFCLLVRLAESSSVSFEPCLAARVLEDGKTTLSDVEAPAPEVEVEEEGRAGMGERDVLLRLMVADEDAVAATR